MTGSSLAPIIIPIVVSISLAAWLIIVYYAARHPQWKSARPAPGEARPALGEARPALGEARPALGQAEPAPGQQTAGTAGTPPELPAARSGQLDDQERHRDLVSA